MRRLLSAALVVLLPAISARAQPPSYSNFEAGQVRPAAMSEDGARLYVVNTPDDRLEIFDLTSAMPALVASVQVGLSPVAVAVQDASRVWVVNHLSDSVSIVDVASDPPHVIETLLVGDEPSDVVFAGTTARRAFITTAHRGQSHPTPRGDYATPGIGRADVWVFDAAAPSAATIVQLFGDRPRALAVSPDGATVYAAVFHSGNRTTTLSEGVVCDGGPTAVCATGPGGLPAPTTNFMGQRAPEVGLIVRFDAATSRWVDELDRDWSAQVRLDLPDHDVFVINADTATATPQRFSGVGTVLFAMAVNPATGALYVSNTDAMNHVRFEGPGRFVREQGLREGQPASVRGHLHEARITVIDEEGVRARHLNPHIPYDAASVPEGTRERSLATPLGMAVSSDGSTLYVAGYGSSAVGVFDSAALAAGTVDTSADRLIDLSNPGPVGPSGLVLDEARGRLYVVTRFDDSLVTVDLETRAVLGRARMHTPEPAETIVGRPMLYDARFTSSNGEAACGSCHVFGDLDGLAWDLGDPDGMVMASRNPRPAAAPSTSSARGSTRSRPATAATRSIARRASSAPTARRRSRTRRRSSRSRTCATRTRRLACSGTPRRSFSTPATTSTWAHRCGASASSTTEAPTRCSASCARPSSTSPATRSGGTSRRSSWRSTPPSRRSSGSRSRSAPRATRASTRGSI